MAILVAWTLYQVLHLKQQRGGLDLQFFCEIEGVWEGPMRVRGQIEAILQFQKKIEG